MIVIVIVWVCNSWYILRFFPLLLPILSGNFFMQASLISRDGPSRAIVVYFEIYPHSSFLLVYINTDVSCFGLFR